MRERRHADKRVRRVIALEELGKDSIDFRLHFAVLLDFRHEHREFDDVGHRIAIFFDHGFNLCQGGAGLVYQTGPLRGRTFSSGSSEELQVSVAQSAHVSWSGRCDVRVVASFFFPFK